MEAGPIVTAKRALRRQVRERRRQRAAAPGRVAAADRLAAVVSALVAQLPCAERGCRVAAYEATATEPPTEALVAALRAAGHDVLLPITNPDLTLDWDLAGVHLPAETIGTADLVLTPGLCVDRSGMRLGQGGGCYDGALAFVPSNVRVVTVLWDDELVDDPVPAQPHDRRVDGVITPGRGVVWFSPDPGIADDVKGPART